MNIIEIDDLHFTYPDGTRALRGVSLSLRAGRSLGLIGPNGAGKSTLLLHLNGILSGAGAVRFRGTPVEQCDSAQLRAAVGLVFEDPDDQLFMPTVLDDVTFGPLNLRLSPEQARTRALQALAAVDAEHLRSRAPHHLSAGQKRRVALATVLAMEPEVLVLDEPVAALDPEGREAIIELLAALEVTRIIASHDLDMILALCDEVALLDDGQIHAQGDTHHILADDDLLRAHGLRVPLTLQLARAPRTRRPNSSE
jgi:cobalt/nickel transport system ATP-binding protein